MPKAAEKQALLIALLLFGAKPWTARAQSLPVPCGGDACSGRAWVTAGNAAAVFSEHSLRIAQSSDSATLNWSSFNVDAGHRVTFEQPSASAVALNRIFQNDPSKIFGVLDANGRVYLLNQNGIVFGDGAQVNVGGLIASSLDITPEALENGIARAAEVALAPAFSRFRDGAGEGPSGAVKVAAGATLQADGGQILLLAPEVMNEGRILTPGGQTVLAAGDSVYLMTNADANFRGLIVEVAGDGTVTNGAPNAGGAVGEIVAERGNVTLAGLAVNQLGRVSATTSVRENGSVRLLARSGASAVRSGGSVELVPTVTGPLTLGEQSVTEVTLAASSDTAVDVTAQPKSTVLMEGYRIDALRDARVTAQSGEIEATARANPQVSPADFGGPTDNRIYLADGVKLDVSGASVELAMERNTVKVELRGNQLRDSPEQRDGPLRGQSVVVDVRRSGVREDGSEWQGTPLADASGEISNVQRDVRERNLEGGTVRLQSAGDVIVAGGATIDVSGGAITYRDGFVKTSQLLTDDRRIVDVGSADRDGNYVAIVEGVVREHRRWGVTETFTGIYGDGRGQFEAGYVEGRDAGALTVLAPRFVLDGTLRGDVVIGPLQRQPAAALASQRVPRGAELVIGSASGGSSAQPNFVTLAMQVAAGAILPGLVDDSGAPFDPLRDRLPESLAVSRVPLHNLGPGHATRVRLYGNETIDVPAATRLELGAGGQFAATAANVTFAGDIVAPSGSVELLAEPTIARPLSGLGLVVGSDATFSLNGLWINDHPLLNPAGATAGLFTAGGSVRITGIGTDVEVRVGSAIDVSGGAWRTRDGRIVPGAAGSVSASSSGLFEAPSVLDFRAAINAYALARGGRLSLTASAFCISDRDCRDGDASTFWLNPDVIARYGLGALSLTSNLRGIALTADTELAATQTNLVLPSASALLPTGTALGAVAGTARLPDHVREPFDLTLSVNALPGFDDLFRNESFAAAGMLHLESGSRIDADPLSTVSLQANTRILIDGTIRAPAGEIAVTLTSSARIGEFLPTQGIYLGDGARLEAPGAVRLVPNDRGLAFGDVLSGGSVSLRANRGFVSLSPGAQIDVSGAAATLDVLAAAGRYEPRSVASAGGLLDVAAAESVVLGGQVRANGGSADALGGTLRVVLDGNTRGADPSANEPVLPLESRQIVIMESAAPLVVGPGVPLPQALLGRALVPAPLVEAAGFSIVDLAARNLFSTRSGSTFLASTGKVVFEGNPLLRADARIVLDAPELVSLGGTATITAPYVALGHRDRINQTAPSVLTRGGGELVVNAGTLDLIGRTTYQGFGRLSLTATGDIRARGVQEDQARSLQGSLTTLGDVTLAAAQIYPSTLTSFDFVVGDGTTGTLSTQTSGVQHPVLSVGGSLTLQAARIEHHGVLRAPFGELSLVADEIVLAPGSTLSTAAGSATTLFGSVQVDDWVYGLGDGQLLVFAEGLEALPEQRVALTSPQVDFREGAVIDVSGGGDLLGYQFIPGVGGSTDVLSAAVEPNTFAIVPGLELELAPFDPQEYEGSSLAPGDSVYLAGLDGLPAGTYQLLPARYALLPGAFLVTPVDGYRDMLSTQRYDQVGGTIIAGRRETFGRGVTDTRTTGFLVRPGTEAQRRAQYDIYGANEFFTERAARTDTIAPRLPVDAGRLAIVARGALALEGTLAAAAAAGGRSAELEFTGDDLRIVADAGSAVAAPGQVLIDAGQLNALGAGSVLIGGSRQRGTAATRIDAGANTVTLDPGTRVAAADIMLVARGDIAIGTDARIEAAGPASPVADTFELNGDAALLRLSSGPQATLLRSGETGTTGTLSLAAGSQLSAPGGSAILSASRDTVSAARFDLGAGALTLGASSITLGDVDAPRSGLVLDAAALAELGGLGSLVLASASGIDLVDVQFGVGGALTLDSAGLRVLGSGTSRVAAADLTLQNSVARAALADLPSLGGDLELDTERLAFGGGNFQVLGGDELRVTARQRFTTELDGRLAVDGAVAVSTATWTGESGTDLDLDVTGRLDILGIAAAEPMAPAEMPALGASVRATADSIVVDTRLELRSGRLALTARGADGVSLLDGAVLDLRGAVTSFDGVAVGARGGDVLLDAQLGSVGIDAGALVDVGAGDVGDAGSVDLRAAAGAIRLDGAVRGAAAAEFRGGSISLDALDPGSLDALSARFGADGFRGSLSIRRRGEGSLELGASSVLRGDSIRLVADQGSVAIRGALDASGVDGGEISLFAAHELVVAGSVTARGLEGEGGRVALFVGDSGALLLNAGASIDVRGDTAGEILLRAPRAAALSLLDADGSNDRLRVAASIRGAERVDAELYSVTVDTDGVLSAAEVAATSANPLFADTAAFMTNAAALDAALDPTGSLGLELRPGIEIRAAGDLTLTTDWNLFPWRFAGSDGVPVPGTLTLRAGGNLNFQRVLSDGFTAASGAAGALLTTTGESWSYRLAAGADLASADPLAVVTQPLRGDLIVGPGTAAVENYIRTGTGRIDVAAARDVLLTNQFSTIYTAGIAQTGAIYELPGGFGTRSYPAHGGDIGVYAGRDIVAARGNQLVTGWLWRVGQGTDGSAVSAAWTVAFDQFDQGIGALGGGDVRIAAGRDIAELSASIPTIGRQVGGLTDAESVVEIGGGGDLRVSAGRDILGGSYYVGRGDAELFAGGRIGAAANSLAPVLVLSDGSITASAVGDVTVESVLDPMLLPQSTAQAPNILTRSHHLSYAPTARTDLTSIGGTVTLRGDASANVGTLRRQLTSMTFRAGDEIALRIYPPTVRATALRGDVLLPHSLTLAPAPKGNLELFAYRDVRADAAANVAWQLLVSDADRSLLPTYDEADRDPLVLRDLLGSAITGLRGFNAPTPVHALASQPDGVADTTPIRFVALTGDISMEKTASSITSQIYLPKAARFIAGRDINSVRAVVQNLTPLDVTTFAAGRDIVNPAVRATAGMFANNRREILIAGPGRLELIAGRDLALGTSNGITTLGNLRNPALPAAGSDISITVGLQGRQADFAAFIERYLAGSDAYDAALIAFVQAVSGAGGLSKAEALEQFRALDRSRQAALIEAVYFNEIREGGRFAASSANSDFTRAFTALETLFPGSNPDLDAGEQNPYSGDVSLFFSRIYTLADGNIGIFAPGGAVNAGLATPPSGLGVNKEAAELGIVVQRAGSVNVMAYSDLLVNESRVFAADGGNILVWSTQGDIDAGRGAKTAISAPPPVISFDTNGNAVISFPAALTGSGIQTLATSAGRKPGDVDLYAPRGVVNAGDAGIVAGNLTIGATAVLGADNIQVSGVAVGVPVDTGGFAAALSGVSAVASSATNAAADTVAPTRGTEEAATPLADQALGFLDVFITGFGDGSGANGSGDEEEECNPAEETCDQ